MKNLLLTFFFLVSIFALYAQAPPQGINYQAVAIDDEGIELAGVDIEGTPLKNRLISVRFTIIKNTPSGPITYRENHTTTTDDYGLFSLVIGQGTQDASPMDFNDIQWNTGNHYLKVEMDVRGGTLFKHVSTTQFWSVPYALYAKSSGNSLVPMYPDQASLPTGDFEVGMLAFVRNCFDLGIPCMVIWDGAQWIYTDNDSDPTNELGLHVVADNAERDLLYPNPTTGDMVWNQATGTIQVFNGTNWVFFGSGTGNTPPVDIYQHLGLLPTTGNLVGDLASVINCDGYGNPCLMVWGGSSWYNTVEYIASNGITRVGQIFQLGGNLNQPTTLGTSSVNTLAITGLQNGNMNTDQLVTINPTTGVLTKTSANDLFQEYQLTYTATAGQTQFNTPIPITDINKVNVYRNGIRVGHVLINANTIGLEPGISCWINDQIRIVQFR